MAPGGEREEPSIQAMARFEAAVESFRREVRITGDSVWVGRVGLGSSASPVISLPITTRPEDVGRDIHRIAELLGDLPEMARNAEGATRAVLSRLGVASEEAEARMSGLGDLAAEIEQIVRGPDVPWHPRKIVGVWRLLESRLRRGDYRIRVSVTTVHVL